MLLVSYPMNTGICCLHVNVLRRWCQLQEYRRSSHIDDKRVIAGSTDAEGQAKRFLVIASGLNASFANQEGMLAGNLARALSGCGKGKGDTHDDVC